MHVLGGGMARSMGCVLVMGRVQGSVDGWDWMPMGGCMGGEMTGWIDEMIVGVMGG